MFSVLERARDSPVVSSGLDIKDSKGLKRTPNIEILNVLVAGKPTWSQSYLKDE